MPTKNRGSFVNAYSWTWTKEGSVFKIRGSGAVYMIFRGYARWIPNPTTYNNLFKSWSIIQTWPASYMRTMKAEGRIGRPITNGATLVKSNRQATVYFRVDGRKLPIADPTTFNHYGFNWRKIKTYSQSSINRIRSGRLMSIKAHPKMSWRNMNIRKYSRSSFMKKQMTFHTKKVRC